MKSSILRPLRPVAVVLTGAVSLLCGLSSALAVDPIPLPVKGAVYPDIPNTVYSAIYTPAVTTGGAVALRIGIKGLTKTDGIDSTNNAVIARFVDGDAETVVQSSDPAPTNYAGTTFGSFKKFGDPVLNVNGDIAFGGTLFLNLSVTAANDTGVWTDLTGTGIVLALREGDDAPGFAGTTPETTGQKFTKVNWFTLTADALYISANTSNGTFKPNGVWKWDGTALTKVVAVYDKLSRPGLPTTTVPNPAPVMHTVKTLSKPASSGTGNAQSRTVSDDNYLSLIVTFSDATLPANEKSRAEIINF